MLIAPHTPDEGARLEALRSLDILDTSAEAVWDRIVQLAAKVCDVPISLVSLVEEDRQWFKAKVGLAVDQTSRESSFCAHALLGTDIFEVEDASKDERFHDNPLVTGDPNIRFYAGTPIHHPDGQPLGTVCVIDRKPKILTTQQREALELLGDQAEDLLAYRHAAIKARDALQGPTPRERQDFLNNVSHEVHTPMTPLLLRMATLRKMLDTDKTKSDIMADMERDLARLQSAVKDLVSVFSGLDQARPE